MKLIIGLIAAFSLNTFASTEVSRFEGLYVNKDTFAFAKAVLDQPGDLFTPDSYVLELELKSSYAYLQEESVTLEPKKDRSGKLMFSRTGSNECDDPGCTYYNDYDFEIDNKLNLNVVVSGTHDDEDNDRQIDFDKEMKLIKAHANSAVLVKSGTTLTSSPLKAVIKTEMDRYVKSLSWNNGELKSSYDMDLLAIAKNGSTTEALYTLTTFKVKEGSYRPSLNQHQCLNVFVMTSGRYRKVVTDCVRGTYYVKGLPLK